MQQSLVFTLSPLLEVPSEEGCSEGGVGSRVDETYNLTLSRRRCFIGMNAQTS
jgi:hypothetical protein